MKTLCICFLMIFLYSKTNAARFEGYVVMKTNDTIFGTLIFSDARMHRIHGEMTDTKVVKIESNGKEQKFAREDVDCYSLKFVDTWETYWNLEVVDGIHMFMKKIASGALTMYSSLSWNPIENMSRRFILMRKANDPDRLFIECPEPGNRKVLLDFFKDCPAIINLIENKSIKVNNCTEWDVLATTYNKSCRN